MKVLLGLLYGTGCLAVLYILNNDPICVLDGCFVGIGCLLYLELAREN